MTATSRTLQARMAAYVLHSLYDSKELTAPARRAFNARFDKGDPDGALPLAERVRRAEAAKKAYFLRLALESAQARRRSKSSSYVGVDDDHSGAADTVSA